MDIFGYIFTSIFLVNYLCNLNIGPGLKTAIYGKSSTDITARLTSSLNNMDSSSFMISMI